jgi:hypothetical protein
MAAAKADILRSRAVDNSQRDDGQVAAAALHCTKK